MGMYRDSMLCRVYSAIRYSSSGLPYASFRHFVSCLTFQICFIVHLNTFSMVPPRSASCTMRSRIYQLSPSATFPALVGSLHGADSCLAQPTMRSFSSFPDKIPMAKYQQN